MFIRLFESNGEYHVLASLSEGRLVVAKYERQHVRSSIKLPENCQSAFATNGQVLATGYWNTKGIDVWNLWTGEHLDRFGPNHTSRLLIDDTGRYVAVWSDRGNFVYDRNAGQKHRVSRMEDLDCACIDHRTNTLWLPVAAKGRAVRVETAPFSMETVALQIRGRPWAIRFSLQYNKVIIFDYDAKSVPDVYVPEGYPDRPWGSVSCFGEIGGELIWRRDFLGKELSSSGAFSSDGKYFAMNAVEAQRIIVMVAETGETVRLIEPMENVMYPMKGTRIMSTSGRIVNVATGEIDEGCSNWQWWRVAGA